MNKLNTLFVYCNQHSDFSVTISPMTSNNILIISLIIINKYNKDKYKDNTLGYILIKTQLQIGSFLCISIILHTR